jgi:hypothetical protein
MSASETEIDEQRFRIIGVGSAVIQAAVFAAVSTIALYSLPYGVIVGVMSGIGGYLFTPWYLHFSAVQENAEDNIPIAEIIEQVPGRPQRSLFGLGLELGAIVMLMIGVILNELDFSTGTASGLLVALFVYLVGTVALNRATTAVD